MAISNVFTFKMYIQTYKRKKEQVQEGAIQSIHALSTSKKGINSKARAKTKETSEKASILRNGKK